MKSEQIIKNILLKTKKRNYSVPQDYFVGVTSNPEMRIFFEHNLSKDGSYYTIHEANSKLEAKMALGKLLDDDMNGFPLNGHIPGKYVYCYFIEGTSKECFASFE